MSLLINHKITCGQETIVTVLSGRLIYL